MRPTPAVHFTGSSGTFRHLFRRVGANIDRYRSYPRVVGETGGKGVVLVHSSADLDAVVPAVVDGAYDYQGQKCSAASRLYVQQPFGGARTSGTDDKVGTVWSSIRCLSPRSVKRREG